MRRTKIVCTLGPASSKEEVLRELVSAGMDVARFNFSHGSHEMHKEAINAVRKVAAEQKRLVSLLLDTQGPEVRVGSIAGDGVQLQDGEKFTLTMEEICGNRQKASLNYRNLVREVSPGQKIFIDDGLIILEVISTGTLEVQCRVLAGGFLRSRKSINIPGVRLNLPAVSKKDREDILFAAANGLDFIAASFVRDSADVLAIKEVLGEQRSSIAVIAKIENQQGVDNIDKILEVADGVMIARGDLGVEIPAEDVPVIQKMIISRCNSLGKPVITATQMLDSMIRSPRPTRAEASDVANAIFDGTDAVMLSGETAIGLYPVEAVHTMSRIITSAEAAFQYEKMLENFAQPKERNVTDIISYATCFASQQLGADAVISSTKTGFTARMVSKYRPKSKIIAVTPREEVARQMALIWGVVPLLCRPTSTTDEMFDAAVETALESGYLQKGSLVVITAGVPLGVSGTTNYLRVHTVGDVRS